MADLSGLGLSLKVCLPYLLKRKEVITTTFLENLTKGLEEIPLFFTFPIRDTNPLGEHTKTRVIEAPNQAMAVVQQRLLKHLRSLSVLLPWSTGAQPSCSPWRAIQRHRANRHFYTIDLHDAYHGVSLYRLALVLCDIDHHNFGYDIEAVQTFLERYCGSTQGGLAIGANASPDLFNIYCHYFVDKPLSPICERNGITYGRYLDDLVFSCNDQIGATKRKKIRKIVLGAGFQIAHHKCHLYDLAKGPVRINGVGLERGGRVFLPRHFFRRIRALIHGYKTRSGVTAEVLCGHMGVFSQAVAGNDGRMESTTAKVLLQYKEVIGQRGRH